MGAPAGGTAPNPRQPAVAIAHRGREGDLAARAVDRDDPLVVDMSCEGVDLGPLLPAGPAGHLDDEGHAVGHHGRVRQREELARNPFAQAEHLIAHRLGVGRVADSRRRPPRPTLCTSGDAVYAGWRSCVGSVTTQRTQPARHASR